MCFVLFNFDFFCVFMLEQLEQRSLLFCLRRALTGSCNSKETVTEVKLPDARHFLFLGSLLSFIRTSSRCSQQDNNIIYVPWMSQWKTNCIIVEIFCTISLIFSRSVGGPISRVQQDDWCVQAERFLEHMQASGVSERKTWVKNWKTTKWKTDQPPHELLYRLTSTSQQRKKRRLWLRCFDFSTFTLFQILETRKWRRKRNKNCRNSLISSCISQKWRSAFRFGVFFF